MLFYKKQILLEYKIMLENLKSLISQLTTENQKLNQRLSRIEQLEKVIIEQLDVDKIEYTYNFDNISINNLSGTLNIGGKYQSIPAKTIKRAVKGSLKRKKTRNSKAPIFNIKFK